jgi:CO/xanthine dehydrogenase FAD-binding subunit
LASASGRRRLPVADFLTGPKRTALAPAELIVAVRFRSLASGGAQEYLKVGTRNAMVIAVASCAVVVEPARHAVRVGLGSVGPVPLRAPAAEAWAAEHVDWAGGAVADVDIFGRLVAEAARPIDDHRSTAAYRRHAIAVLAARGLRRCLRNGTEAAA